MDILKILLESPEALYPEDLDFFETELSTGGYKADYVSECRTRISKLRVWMSGDMSEPLAEKSAEEKVSGKLFVSLSNLTPKQLNPTLLNKTPLDIFKDDLANIRNKSDYKKRFKAFVDTNENMNSEFIDKNFGIFEPWEIVAIISVKQMGEEFLEKYFGSLDSKKISRYQKFSEKFFMKHFSQLDATIVLTKGKNEWRKKENRSKQLDVFLRLKGIKL